MVGVLLVLNDNERGSSLCMLYHIDAVSRLADSPFASVHFRLFRTAFVNTSFQLMVGSNPWVDVMGKVVAILRSALAGHRSHPACSAHLSELSKRVKEDCVPFIPSPRLRVDSP